MELHGEYRIEARDAATGALLWEKRLCNLLTNVSQTVRLQQLAGTYTAGNDYLAIKYFAIGVGTSAPTVEDRQLENERYRKQVTSFNEIAPGVLQTTVSLGATEANWTIREIGVFCGEDATNEANTGLLLSRVAVNIEKNTNMVLNIVRTDTCLINT